MTEVTVMRPSPVKCLEAELGTLQLSMDALLEHLPDALGIFDRDLWLAEVQQLDDVVLTEQAFRNYLTELDVPGSGREAFKVEGWPVVSGDGQRVVYLLLLENLTSVVRQLKNGVPGDADGY
ncbi:hypothetical protein [Deinococcus ruber]|nr:hypothetical protein [Deinococcus ruber]